MKRDESKRVEKLKGYYGNNGSTFELREGQKFYRFKFETEGNGSLTRDVFEIVGLYEEKGYAHCSSVYTKCLNHINHKFYEGRASVNSFSPENLGKVTTAGSDLYVMLDKDDVSEAWRIAVEYARARSKACEEKYYKAQRVYGTVVGLAYLGNEAAINL